MEESRLKPMPKGYNPDLFNDLYKKTEGLRRKLASEISHHRFGVDYEEVLSWFSVKFIHVFNKYHDKKPDLLLGDIINSLKNFKCRILRQAYTVKYSQSIIRVGDTSIIENSRTFEPTEDEGYESKVEQVKKFFKAHLSPNAYFLFELQINPPFYVIHKLRTQEIPNIHKIPNEVILEYLGLEENEKTIKYIKTLRKEIKNLIPIAKHHLLN